MNNININKVVCTVSEEELERLREQQRARFRHDPCSTRLRDPVWREIAISATPERIKVNLGNIDEEAARGGYCNARYACTHFTLTWPDLADADGLENLVKFEPMVVAKKVLEALEHLREMSTAVQELLAV